MGAKRTPGLFKRGKYWHIKKTVCGVIIRESTRTGSLDKAELYLSKRAQEVRNYIIFGERPKKIFAEGAVQYIEANKGKASLKDDLNHLKKLNAIIGHIELEKINNQTLKEFIEKRKTDGVKNKTINNALSIVRRILNLSATEWKNEDNTPWIANPSKITMLDKKDTKLPQPLTLENQKKLFNLLPQHLHDMCLFKVNTGTRDQEVCNLHWDWEFEIPELSTSVFIIPGEQVKNSDDRLVVLNKIAEKVINKRRNIHPEYVFTYKDKKLTKMNNTAWKNARKKASLEEVRIHDLKHTFGERLRANGVSHEDRQELLGHRASNITTHYSGASIQKLIDAANTVCETSIQQPIITLRRLQKKKT